MFCVKCGKNIEDNAVFCKYCGETTNTNTNSIRMNTNQRPIQTKKKKQNPALVAIGVIIIVVGLWLVLSGLNTMLNNTSTFSNTTLETNEINVNKDETTKNEKITLEKFNKIETGMTYQQVIDIIGEEGTLSTESSYGNQTMKIYYWYSKNGMTNATISFYNGKVNAKSQVGLK